LVPRQSRDAASRGDTAVRACRGRRYDEAMCALVTAPSETVRPGGGLETVTRAFALLECFEADRVMTLSDLSRACGLSKPTTLRFARKLSALGMLEQHGRHYRLGLRLFELGNRVDQQRLLRERALPYMQRIFEVTHRIVHLAVPADTEIVFVERLRSRNGRDLPSQLGARMPMHSTALGKALLAYSPPELVERVLAGPLAALTERTCCDPLVLSRELTEIRRSGVAVSSEECVPQLQCVAAPIFDHAGVARAALSISAYREQFDRVVMVKVARRAARAIERELARP
jgi:IclR family acetate operon transcriptional repressor